MEVGAGVRPLSADRSSAHHPFRAGSEHHRRGQLASSLLLRLQVPTTEKRRVLQIHRCEVRKHACGELAADATPHLGSGPSSASDKLFSGTRGLFCFHTFHHGGMGAAREFGRTPSVGPGTAPRSRSRSAQVPLQRSPHPYLHSHRLPRRRRAAAPSAAAHTCMPVRVRRELG